MLRLVGMLKDFRLVKLIENFDALSGRDREWVIIYKKVEKD